MYRKINRLIRFFEEDNCLSAGRKGFVGFDGFIDSIVRPVKARVHGLETVHFTDMSEFGAYVTGKNNNSCCIELEEQTLKIGGNGPILANALGCLGVKAECVGTMGYPEINEVFRPMLKNNCALYSCGDPGYTVSLEFSSGKLMMAKMGDLKCLKWDDITRAIGIDSLIGLFKSCDFIAMVNWSEVYNSNSIWEGIISDVLKVIPPQKPKLMFFDLSDCSSRSPDDIRNAFRLMGCFRDYFKVALGMNENEARTIFGLLYKKEGISDIDEIGARIYEKLSIDILVIHPTSFSIAWDTTGVYKINNFYTKNPRLSTGGGDHFNAGFCISQVMGLDMEESMIFANAVSGFYIRNGFSPDKKNLLDFLLEWQSSCQG